MAKGAGARERVPTRQPREVNGAFARFRDMMPQSIARRPQADRRETARFIDPQGSSKDWVTDQFED